MAYNIEREVLASLGEAEIEEGTLEHRGQIS